MTKDNPYISFIGFARNDDYRPNRAKIHNLSINFLLQQLNDYKIPSEIILVEWNYPEGRPPLAEIIQIRQSSPFCLVKVIRVPAQYHQKYRHWQFKPFHVGAALNVGIRRAKGEFILPIASDVFLTDDCLRIIAKRELDENKFYRCDRYDVSENVIEKLESSSPINRNSFFKDCDANLIIHHKYLEQSSSYQIADLHSNASGDFYLTAKHWLHQVRGSKEGMDVGALDIDSLTIHALNGLGIKQEILPDSCRVYKFRNAKSTAIAVKQVWRPWQQKLEAMLFKYSNYNVAINFRMKLNYPKRKYCHAPEALFDSFETNFVRSARQWAKKNGPFYLNDEDWGLATEALEEIKIE